MLRHGTDIEGIVAKISTPKEVLELLKGNEEGALTSERVLAVFRASFAKKIALLREYGYETLVYAPDELFKLRPFVDRNGELSLVEREWSQDGNNYFDNEPDLDAWGILQRTVGKIRDLIHRDLTGEGFKVISVEQDNTFDGDHKRWQKVVGHPDWLAKTKHCMDSKISPFKISGKGEDRRLEMPDLRHENLVDEHIVPAFDVFSLNKQVAKNPYGFFRRRNSKRSLSVKYPGGGTLFFAPNLGVELKVLGSGSPLENLKILLDALEGYKHLLSLNLVHCDFHPGNIAMIQTPEGLVGKVFDFEALGKVGKSEDMIIGTGLFGSVFGWQLDAPLVPSRMVLEFLLCNVMACFIPFGEISKNFYEFQNKTQAQYDLRPSEGVPEASFHGFLRGICADRVPEPILEMLLKMAKEEPEERASLEEVTACLQGYLRSCAAEGSSPR